MTTQTLPLRREFSVEGEHAYDRRGPVRWILSHVLRYKRFVFSFFVASTVTAALFSAVPALTGECFLGERGHSMGATKGHRAGVRQRMGKDSTGAEPVADAQQAGGAALALGPKCRATGALWHNDLSVVSARDCGDLPVRSPNFPLVVLDITQASLRLSSRGES